MQIDHLPRQFDSIQEALHCITEKKINYFLDPVAGTPHFYDTVSAHLHLPGTFNLFQPITEGNKLIYQHAWRPQVLLQDVSDNFLVRCMYKGTCPYVNTQALFSSIRLSGIRLPPQVMCSAAGLSNCVAPKDAVSNVSGGQFSRFKLLLAMGFPIVEHGELIRDKFGNSIVDVVSDCNLKYLVKAIKKTDIQQFVASGDVLSTLRSRYTKKE